MQRADRLYIQNNPGRWEFVPQSEAGCAEHEADGQDIIYDAEKKGFWFRKGQANVTGVLFAALTLGIGYYLYKYITTDEVRP